MMQCKLKAERRVVWQPRLTAKRPPLPKPEGSWNMIPERAHRQSEGVSVCCTESPAIALWQYAPVTETMKAVDWKYLPQRVPMKATTKAPIADEMSDRPGKP